MIVPDEFLNWKGDYTATPKVRQRIVALVDALQMTVKRVNTLEAALEQHKHTDECKSHGVFPSHCIKECKDSWRKSHGDT